MANFMKSRFSGSSHADTSGDRDRDLLLKKKCITFVSVTPNDVTARSNGNHHVHQAGLLQIANTQNSCNERDCLRADTFILTKFSECNSSEDAKRLDGTRTVAKRENGNTA